LGLGVKPCLELLGRPEGDLKAVVIQLVAVGSANGIVGQSAGSGQLATTRHVASPSNSPLISADQTTGGLIFQAPPPNLRGTPPHGISPF
jgi:hypothetical protein